MLNEYRAIYEANAKLEIPNWKKADKNDLIRKASELENGPVRDSYVSAIILRYWNKLNRYYARCKLVATAEDVHAWLTMAVMYALDKKPWLNEKSSIYNDPTGPDKVINRTMECRRITFYQQLNRFNRKVRSASLSLDSLEEDFQDAALPTYEDSYLYEIYELVVSNFNKKDYLMSFIIDFILKTGTTNSEDNHRRFITHIKSLDNNFAEDFSERYCVGVDDAISGVEWCHTLTADELRRKVWYKLIKLKELIEE